MSESDRDPTERPLWALALLPAAMGFAAAARARSALYSWGVLPSFDAPVPVVSVGNVTAGGTGKTPIVERVARGLLERGRRPAIVSRGYGGTEAGPSRVPSAPGESSSPARFGDEPTWLARALPGAPTFVGRDRLAAARFAKSEAGCDAIVADDAFQHRRLKRAFDLVVVDATEPLWHYWPLPMGRAREPLSALARADAVVINKINLVSKPRLDAVRAAVAKSTPDAGDRVRECEYRVATLLGRDGRAVPARSLSGARAFCATGIGRPSAFRETVRSSVGCEIAGWIDFPDHRLFDERDLARIERDALACGADAIFASEKDATKLAGWDPKVPLFVTRLSAELTGGWESLHERIDRSLR